MTTGDRSGLGRAANDAMRGADPYHLVSISGMHLAMLAASCFWPARASVAAVAPLALRLDARKSAAAALPASAFYFALAGRDVATDRNFLMVAVSLAAMLLDRRALSLRGLVIAALIVLGLRPGTLFNPGFQLSFAAVLALVAVMGRLPPGWHRPRAGAALDSGGDAVADFVICRVGGGPLRGGAFQPRGGHYGLLANLLAVPAMGRLVTFGAAIIAVTEPLGLDRPAIWIIGYGSR